MTKKYLLNPFNALYLYQDDVPLSDKLEIQELNNYAIALEDKIAGDFDLDYMIFEFAHNQFSFVRNGLLLAKIKFLKLHKNYGDGTFASFCREQLRKQRWQINDTIKAARVVLELMYAGFEILPTNISQAITLAKLTGETLVRQWRIVISTIPLDKITAKSIRDLIFPNTEKTVRTIQVPPEVHEDIHREAAERGLSIVELLKMMLEFLIDGENSHFLQPEIITSNYSEKNLYQGSGLTISQKKAEQIWQEDLEKIVEEKEKSLLSS